MSEKQVFRFVYVAWVVTTGMLALAIFGRHPYQFYTQLRWICSGAFMFSAFAFIYSAIDVYLSCRRDPDVAVPVAFHLVIAVAFAAGALVFNPLVPFHFGRDTWQLLDKLSLGFIIVISLICWTKLEAPASLTRCFKWLAWLLLTGLVVYYTAKHIIHIYGKYVLATASTTATVYEMDEEAVDSDTGPSGVKYTGVYKFLVNGKTYYGRTDNYDVGDNLVVRYNPANPDENRDATEDPLAAETTSFIGFIVIGATLYYWLKWIRDSEKTLPCVKHPNRRTKKRFYHWVEDGRFNYVLDHGPCCDECLARLRELHRTDGCCESLYKPLPEPFSVP